MNFKKRKKSKIFVKPDCGNVEHNQAIFNNMNSATEGPCVNPCGPMSENLFCEEINMRNDEKITLDYPKLQFLYQGPMRDVDDWDEYDVTMDWSIDVDKEDIITCLYEDCITDEVVPNWYEMTTEEGVKYVEDHFDELFERYHDEILNYFEEDAVEDAEKNYDPDDYVDWDSMPGGHDDIREDCSKKEDIDDVDDIFEYVAVLDNPYEHLCKEESCEKVDDEISDNWL